MGTFSDRQIFGMLRTVPALPDLGRDQPQVALTLCRTLDTLAHTVVADIEIMRRVYGRNKLFVSQRLSQFAPSDIYLPEGAPEFEPNKLWWEIIYLGANLDKAPDQVSPVTAVGTQLLGTASHHPAAVFSHDGRNYPYWDIPGLRFKIASSSEPFAPYICGDSDGRVRLDTSSVKFPRTRYAEPVVVPV